MREVHVVVVAYHGAELLGRALESVGMAAKVLVVDNSSSPDVRAVTELHGAEYVDSGANRGFAGGVNVALARLSSGPPVDVLLLNPDAELPPGAVPRLASVLHEPVNARVGAISPSIVTPDGHRERVSWPWPSPRAAWRQALGLRPRDDGRYVIGAVLLLRWEALQDVGGFDERFFLYAEETDWQRRAAQRGWTLLELADVEARHVGAGMSSDPRRRETLFLAGGETYIRKWYGNAGWASYRLASLCGALARAAVRRGDRRRLALVHASVLLQGPRKAAGFDAVR